MVTNVVYHYVRDLPRTRWPAIKGRLTSEFEEQLDYIGSWYTVVSCADVIAAARSGERLPDNACVLTFDDGFVDHYETVLPRLLERGMTAGFFASTGSARDGRLLDVHKIHFLLAAAPPGADLAAEVLDAVDRLRDAHPDTPPREVLYERHARPSRYDPAEVVFVKRALQTVLPRPLRTAVLDDLFARHVTADAAGFAAELYVSVEQLREMAAAGMEIGGHGVRHDRLASLDDAEQAAEIDGSLELLELVHGARPRDWVMSYPYGSYDERAVAMVRDRGCALGWTTRLGVAEDLSTPLEMPRLDTNDLPTVAGAPPVEWTRRVLAQA